MKRTIQAVLGTACVAGAGLLGGQPAWAGPETCETTISDDAEIRVCASLDESTTRPGDVRAYGSAIEMHEYLREVRIVATLERRNTAGQWEVIARDEAYDREGAWVYTADRPGTGTLRACATGGITGHEMNRVCTA